MSKQQSTNLACSAAPNNKRKSGGVTTATTTERGARRGVIWGGDDDNNDDNKGMTAGMAMIGLTGAWRGGDIQTTINQSCMQRCTRQREQIRTTREGGKNWGNDRVNGGAKWSGGDDDDKDYENNKGMMAGMPHRHQQRMRAVDAMVSLVVDLLRLILREDVLRR